MPEEITDTEILAEAIGLLPCPMCGSEAKVSTPYGVQCVICKSCHLTISDHDGRGAIRKWNTRLPIAGAHGWKLVPVVPTSAMRLAGKRCDKTELRIYQAMVNAAP